MINKKIEKQNFSEYLDEARSWEVDRVRLMEKSLRTAWVVASVSALIAIVAVIAVAVLGPQKTAVPYVIRVNNVTGAVDVVEALKDGKANYDEVMNKYHVQWYVRWREGYSDHLVGEYYKNVGLMSSLQEQNKYSAWMSRKNPQSPLNVYGKEGKVAIVIKSISFIKDNIALVRYTKNMTKGAAMDVTHWAATITFQYASTPMSEQDRAINPLGFQVIEYRNDPDQELTVSSQSNSNLITAPTLPQDASQLLVPAVPAIQ